MKNDKTTTILLMLARLSGTLALLTGAAFWLGIGGLPLHLHMALGAVLVLLAWVLAARAVGRRAGPAAALFLVAALVPILGILQLAGPLFGSLTLTRLLHVLVALATLGLAESLAKKLRS